ncbi:hypothetical protein ARALYDRAFT_350029 [Arabidopsis lyrata subsp. lyrata]|uniref:Uncharacterized protein n=1 Tax=Arabidopsis lyrata subsp. lyrata TaxID=81972 RepID=D7M0L1_ARALL|nr:hypothetical protein ARALYDRAFT_350029 [Arabidopsis lyrata subsp. lyrata]
MVVSGEGWLRNWEKLTGSPSFDSKSFSYLQSSIIQDSRDIEFQNGCSDMDSEARNTLMAAADKCVSVEFLLFEEQASSLSYTQEKINRFLRCLSDLDNCSFQTCIPDGKSLHGLEKRWLQELKDDSGE